MDISQAGAKSYFIFEKTSRSALTLDLNISYLFLMLGS
jgi:hypothetical protein